ncbi:MAG: cation transporter [Caldilinea sp. CFX5]|nr:cation transporter [Caldilinea sp. CFX5]
MTLFTTSIDLLILLLSVSLALCFLRLYRGPDVPNRVVAFDLIAIHAVAIIALFAIKQGAVFLLDVTIITGVLGFLGTVMVARYLEQSKREE